MTNILKVFFPNKVLILSIGNLIHSLLYLAVDLQLSIKVFGPDGLRAAGQVLYKTFDLRTAVCRPYKAKLLHHRLINLLPKNHQHILLPNLCPHLPSNVH
jgi:hypothetical protein